MVNTDSSRIGQGYCDWRQVAGYSDGDGSNHVYYSRFTLRFTVTWCDSSLQQLTQLREFIASCGIRPSPKITFTSGAHVLIIGIQAEVLKTARELLPFVFKKRDEFQTIVDYLEDRITGTEVFQRFKAFQDLGIREKSRYPSNGEINIPYRRSEGQVLGKSAGGRPPILKRAQILEIQYSHNVLGRTLKCLAAEFGVSPSTVKSALSTDTTTIHDE
jgi:hypothetical protein